MYTFGWVGMRLVSEHSNAAPHTTVYHAYNDQSYTTLARIECTDNPLNPQRAIYYTHSSLSGLPEALTNSEGEIVWQGQYSAWGHLQRQTRPTSTFNREQNLRFQGQYFDKETGLHYNTFRYYAPDLGRFTQQDPIGLAGGINLYAYAPNPLTWVDPWGWSCGSKIKQRGALNWKAIVSESGETRIQHVIKGHGTLNPEKPIQTLFYKNPISEINRAWRRRMKRNPSPDYSNDVTDIFIIDINKTIGYNRDTGEQLSKIKIIVKRNTNKIITGFPTN